MQVSLRLEKGPTQAKCGLEWATSPSGLTDSEEYTVNTVGTFNKLKRLSTVGDEIENHHLIPKSVACILGVASGEILSIALLHGPHQAYDNAWDAWFRKIGAQGQRCNENLVTIKGLLAAAEVIYAADPQLVQQIQDWFATISKSGLP